MIALLATVLAFAGCSSSGGSSSVSVFSVKPGECFTGPSTVQTQLSELTRVPCSKPHTKESYATVEYRPSADALASGAPSDTTDYPGADVLTNFAQGACAQQFSSYVGIDYLDSKLYFTYLLPSPRSWQQEDDRTVTCFITTAGNPLTRSVKGAKI